MEQNTKPPAKATEPKLHLDWRTRLVSYARWTWEICIQGQRRLRGALEMIWRSERSRLLRGRLQQAVRATGQSLKGFGPSLRRGARRSFWIGGLLALVVLVVTGVGRFALHAIEPGEVGVRYSKWSGDGVVMHDFGPGLHFSLPGVHKWQGVPSGTQLLTWRFDPVEEHGTQLDVRTIDGTSVALEVCVPIRIQEGLAHRIVAEGHRSTYREQARAKSERALLDELGQLDTEQFSTSDELGAVVDAALLRLNTSLAEIHLVAEQILIDEVRFSKAYEKKLVEKQREQQRGRVLEARQLEDQEQQTILRRRNEIDQELLALRIRRDREIEDLRSEGQTRAVEISSDLAQYESTLKADAERDYDQLVAQGEAALLEAQLLEKQLHAEILSGPGGAEHLALQMARATRIEQAVLNSNDERVPNPLDMESMLSLFGISE